MKHVVIIGAGFGGVSCAKSLIKENSALRVTIIDKNNYHNVHGNLYEVASMPAELVELRELKKSVNIPLEEIFKQSKIEVEVGLVDRIESDLKLVWIGERKINYDYLVIAQGAEANFYGIPGAEEHSIALQSSRDALLISNFVEQSILEVKQNHRKKQTDIVIVGGGVAGVELATELQGMISFLCWQNNIPKEKIKTHIVERDERVLSTLPLQVSQIVQKRLQELSINVHQKTAIIKVTPHRLKTESGEEINHDVLIWTAGVKPVAPQFNNQELGKLNHGRFEVDNCFKLDPKNSIFVIGDQCCYHDQSGDPLPGTAAQAIHQGKFVAKTLVKMSRNQSLPSYQCRTFPMVITLGQRWAVFAGKRIMLTGYTAYLVREFIWFKYFISILGLKRGLHWLLRSESLYHRND